MRENNKSLVLVLDVGTTGVKALVFDKNFGVVARAYQPLRKFFPHAGWVEQDPMELLEASSCVLKEAVRKSGAPPAAFLGMGLTNQRETTILWDKKTGRPVYPAIVWEDTRTAGQCRRWDSRFGTLVREKTGLPVTSYSSASKIRWIIENVREVRRLLTHRKLLFGTVDSWIAWNFLEHRPHVTDFTNASRTLLFNIRTLRADLKLLTLFGIPRHILPKAMPSRADFGRVKKEIFGFSLPLRAMCGDQQASQYAAGLKTGTVKVTYGTGTFISAVIGREFRLHPPFFTALAPCGKRPVYALEAKIDCCGKRVEPLLGKPALLRKLIEDLTRRVAEYLRQLPERPREIIVDGGVTRYRGLAGFQSRAASVKVKKQTMYDGTALGTAMLVRKGKLVR